MLHDHHSNLILFSPSTLRSQSLLRQVVFILFRMLLLHMSPSVIHMRGQMGTEQTRRLLTRMDVHVPLQTILGVELLLTHCTLVGLDPFVSSPDVPAQPFKGQPTDGAELLRFLRRMHVLHVSLEIVEGLATDLALELLLHAMRLHVGG